MKVNHCRGKIMSSLWQFSLREKEREREKKPACTLESADPAKTLALPVLTPCHVHFPV